MKNKLPKQPAGFSQFGNASSDHWMDSIENRHPVLGLLTVFGFLVALGGAVYCVGWLL